MKKQNLLLIAAIAMAAFACSDGDNYTPPAPDNAYSENAKLRAESKELFGTLPGKFASNVNQLTEEKIALGRKLYFDKRLSKDNTVSCNSCHMLETGTGVDNKPFSPGVNGTLGGRNSPTVLNAAFHSSQFWDGRSASIEEQAGEPILNPVEMAMPNEQFVVDKLKKTNDYPEAFAKVFPNDADPLNYNNLELAIGAFERTLVTPSRFDEFLAGNDDALTANEKDGLKTFMDVGCTTCHLGNALGGNMFQKFGVYDNYWEHTNSEKVDNGKFDVSGLEAEKFLFKVPTLRNVAKTAPYFHDGSVDDLATAIEIMGKLQLDKELSDQEVKDIEAFLKSLNGELDPALIALSE